MKVTIATWNMDHWKRTPVQRRGAWARLNDVGADVALLQETVPPEHVGRGAVVWREIGRERRFGSAVASLKGWPIEEITTAKSCYSYLSFPLLGTFPGSVAITRVRPPDLMPITLVSVYGVIDVYSTTTLFRQVADLMPLFDSADGERVILGGDLNVSTQGPDEAARARYRAVFGAIESLGLVDLFRAVRDRPAPRSGCTCGLGDGCYHVGTHRNASRGADQIGSHLDYLFASPALAERCTRLRLVDDAGIWNLSDHCPVVAEFDLERDTGETAPWDDRYVSDVADTVRPLLAERRDWGRWSPGTSPAIFRTDRGRKKWAALFLEGTLADGRPAQVEAGIWRNPKSGIALGAYVGLGGKPFAEKLQDILLHTPTGSPAQIVKGKYAEYFVVPVADGALPETEARAALDALADCLRRA
jgi:endonuclease/exonuclease/phosphatase family metal-dependent hydrolase